MKSSPFKISDCIVKYLQDKLSENEKEYLESWINSDKENEKLFQELTSKTFYLDRRNLYRQFNNKKDFQQIQKHIQKKRRVRLYYVLGYVASIAILIIGVFLWKQNEVLEDKTSQLLTQNIEPGEPKAILEISDGATFNLTEQEVDFTRESGIEISKENNTLAYQKSKKSAANTLQKEKYNTLFVPKGGEYKLILSDGTKVWLNSETQIKYPVEFLNKERKVYVSGEAYFEVAYDDQKPFVVYAGATQIEVLGTSFNLRSYNDEEIQQTTLVKGSVAVTSKNNTSIISPSEQYTYHKATKTHTIQKVDTNLYTSWKDGLFIFNSQPLEYILRDMSRWYNVEIRYDNEELKSHVFSGRLKKYEKANSLLEVFEKTGNLWFEKQDNVIYVKARRK